MQECMRVYACACMRIGYTCMYACNDLGVISLIVLSLRHAWNKFAVGPAIRVYFSCFSRLYHRVNGRRLFDVVRATTSALLLYASGSQLF